MATDANPQAAATLSVLISALGEDVVACTRPTGEDPRVESLTLHDLAGTETPPAGGLVLGIGLPVTLAAASVLIDAAATSGAAGVVLRGDAEQAGELLGYAQRRGVVVLVIRSSLRWEDVYSSLRRVLLAFTTWEPHEPLGDLYALANALAATAGGAVTIENSIGGILAYSSTDHTIDERRRSVILGRQVPSSVMRRNHERGIIERLRAGEIVEVGTVEGDVPRVVIGVLAAEEYLGSIWLIADGLRPGLDEALREAARLVALQMLRTRSMFSVGKLLTSERLRAAISGRVEAGHDRAELGIPVNRPAVVFAVRVIVDSGPSMRVLTARAVDIIGLHVASLRSHSACVEDGDVVYVALGLPPEAQVDTGPSVALVTDVVTLVSRTLRTPAIGALGRAVAPGAGLAVSRADADAVLHAMSSHPELCPVSTIEAARDLIVLRRLDDLARSDSDLLEGKVAQLIRIDAARKTAYVETLRIYFATSGDSFLAARALDIHPNTFRYRMRKLREAVGLDVNDPVQRLTAELQLRWADLAPLT